MDRQHPRVRVEARQDVVPGAGLQQARRRRQLDLRRAVARREAGRHAAVGRRAHEPVENPRLDLARRKRSSGQKIRLDPRLDPPARQLEPRLGGIRHHVRRRAGKLQRAILAGQQAVGRGRIRPVGETIVVGVRQQRVRPALELHLVRQAVAVRILVAIQHAVVVRVVSLRIRAAEVLVAVRQPVAVRIVGQVGRRGRRRRRPGRRHRVAGARVPGRDLRRSQAEVAVPPGMSGRVGGWCR